MLATAIRKNTNIKGISVNNVEIKLSQYADDTTLILDGSRESLLSSLAMLDDFSKVSGLRLNDKKTEALWIGASIGNVKILLSGKELKVLLLFYPKNPGDHAELHAPIQTSFRQKIPRVGKHFLRIHDCKHGSLHFTLKISSNV